MLTGFIGRDCAGADRTDTLPTAADLVAAAAANDLQFRVGDQISLTISNWSDAAETITIAAGTGGAFDASQTAASKVIEQKQSNSPHPDHQRDGR